MNVYAYKHLYVCELYIVRLSNGIVLVVVLLAIVGEMLKWQRACYHFRSVRGIKVCSLITTYRTALSILHAHECIHAVQENRRITYLSDILMTWCGGRR